MLDDPGLFILLSLQLALSIWAMIAWGRVWWTETPAARKMAAAASASWFAAFAALIGYLFDVGYMP